jgi:hypothetical protein
VLTQLVIRLRHIYQHNPPASSSRAARRRGAGPGLQPAAPAAPGPGSGGGGLGEHAGGMQHGGVAQGPGAPQAEAAVWRAVEAAARRQGAPPSLSARRHARLQAWHRA